MSQDLDRLAAALSDRYPIERELGRGGMATVYLAHDVKHARQVAIKVLHPDLAASIGADRFVREIEIAARLAHPHILPLFDSGEADGFLYYVMPYVDGESLHDRLQRTGPLPLAEVVRLTEQVASALSYAHEQGVIHRDIKPGNILLAGDQAIVADFGIARAVAAAGGTRITGTGLAIGTPAYMSPEQAFGSASIDTTTDVYALGCVVYEMLAGHPPFEGATPQALMGQHALETVPGLHLSDAGLTASVERVVLRALAKEPGDRFQTAGGLAVALAGAITDEARAEEVQRRTRRRWARGAIGVSLVAALSLGGWWIRGQFAARPIELLAVLPASNMTRDPAQDFFVDGVHEALVTELQRAGLSIIARQSVLQYRDTDKPIRQIAKELGVDALIQPAVGRSGDSVFVDISLYDGPTQLPLWTESFPARIEGVLGVYREVSRRIAKEIGVVLSTQATGRLAERPAIDPRAYEAILQGRFHLQRFTPQDITLALQYFEAALAIEPDYAPAHVGIARVWLFRSQYGITLRAESQPIVERHLSRALALDPQLVSALALEASDIVWGQWKLEAGAEAFRRVIALDPNEGGLRAFYGHVLMIQGKPEEALREGRLALQLDPLNAFVTGLYGTILAMTGHPEEAIVVLQDMFERDPGAGFGVTALLTALREAGRYAEEFQLQRTQFASNGDQALVAALDSGLAAGGYTMAWKNVADVLASRQGREDAPSMNIATFYALAGEDVLAMEWLEHAVAQQDQNVPYIGVIPVFRKLHGDPRFQALARRVGVPLVALPRRVTTLKD
jgi:TolB-like protein/tetratricopeptide (TPR) repeat protein